MRDHNKVEFIVGSELSLHDILNVSDITLFLKAIVKAGSESAAITDEKGKVICVEGNISAGKELSPVVKEGMAKSKYEGENWRLSPIYHEAELIGFLFVSVPIENKDIPGFMEIALTSFNIMLKNTIKRMLTSQAHTTAVNQSYEELLETNRRLSISEKRYREMAQTLEQKVEERTAELKQAHTRLLQQEKMASIGQLAAGVAHEINNPMGFISSKLNTFARYTEKLTEMLGFYHKVLNGITNNPPLPPFTKGGELRSPPLVKGDVGGLEGGQDGITAIDDLRTALKQSEELYKKLRIDFILNDINDLVAQSKEGAERIKQIVLNLRGFSHIDETAIREMDINEELDNTIGVLSHEIKGRAAEVIKDYGHVPGLYGNPGLICQVLLNILLNAIQSREDGLIISIKTGQLKDNIVVSIADNGGGIPPDIRSHIFEPFFTTKDVGKGTGMGLTVAYDIVNSYGGNIEVESETGKGTKFIITLPVLKGK